MAEETVTRRDGQGRFLSGDPAAVVVPIRRAAPRPTRRIAKRAPVAWTKKREERFLAALAESSNVAASARAAGVGRLVS